MDDAEEEEDEAAGAGAIPELGGENRDDARGHEGRGVVGVEEGNREQVHVEGAGEGGGGGGNEATVTNARCILKELESNYDRDRRRLQWHLNACVRRENLGNVHPTLMGSSQDLRAVEDRLKELVLLPLRFPHLFQARMLHGRRTLLLYGHKGTGKTQMMREFLAADICCELLCVSAANLLFTAVACGLDGRKLMRGVIERAREAVPCVLCVEDIELLGSSRALTEAVGRVRGLGDEDCVKIHEPLFVASRNMKTELLVSMDEIQRFVVRCFFPMPAAEERVAILMRGLEGVPHQLNHKDLREIGNMTVRFSRGDMAVLADEAQGQMKALSYMSAQITDEDVGRMIQWNDDFGPLA
nr:hypothetical protein BaRGS_031607 [Batillaria attramentaria]